MDQLGTPRLVTDPTGNVVARHDYLPFGEEIATDTGGRIGIWRWGSAYDTVNQKFTGQERDPETGLDYYNARYMASMSGRFVSPDPGNAGAVLTEPRTWNAYAYVGNSPLTYTDPSGMNWFSDIWDKVEQFLGVGGGGGCDALFCATAYGTPYVDTISLGGGGALSYGTDPSGGTSGGGTTTFTTTVQAKGDIPTVGTPTQSGANPPKNVFSTPGNCVAGFTAAGAGMGAAAGAWAGGGIGGAGGAAGGTLVAPGVGTIGGGVLGAEAGAAGGALVGGGLGAGAGYFLGNIVCSSRSGNGGDYRDKIRGANANDKQQIRTVAREECVDANRFGKWLEMEKRAEGRGPSDNYTYGELKQLAQTYKAAGGR